MTEELRLLDNARRARENASQELGESDFYTFYRHGWEMNRELATTRTALGFQETLVPSWVGTVSYADVDEGIDTIQSELQSISHCLSSGLGEHRMVIATASDLESLVRSVFRDAPDTQSASQLLEDCLLQSDLATIFTTFVLTAARDWILNAAFPTLEDGTCLSAFFSSWRATFLDCGTC